MSTTEPKPVSIIHVTDELGSHYFVLEPEAVELFMRSKKMELACECTHENDVELARWRSALFTLVRQEKWAEFDALWQKGRDDAILDSDVAIFGLKGAAVIRPKDANDYFRHKLHEMAEQAQVDLENIQAFEEWKKGHGK